jgi:Zn-dependent protease
MNGLSFRLGNIPVLVRPEFFILPLISLFTIGAAQGVVWVAIVFVSVLWHELGHAFAMRTFGYAPRIVLHSLGGWTLWPEGAQPSHQRRLIVSLAGPGAELVVGLGLYYALRPLAESDLAHFALEQWFYVNVTWACVNLLPILPWDGGHALDSTVALLTGKARSKAVGVVSIVGGLGIVGVALFLRNIMLGYLGGIGVMQGFKRVQASPEVEASPQLNEARALLEAGEAQRAADVLTAALATEKNALMRGHLLEVLAWAKLSMRDFDAAQAAVAQAWGHPMPPELLARLAAHRQQHDEVVKLLAPLARANRLRSEAWPLLMAAVEDPRVRDEIIAKAVSRLMLSPEELKPIELASAKLFYAGSYEAALAMCDAAFRVSRNPLFAFNAACSACRLGNLDLGFSWLTRAVEAGYRDAQTLDSDPDIAPLRDRPGFADMRARLPLRPL